MVGISSSYGEDTVRFTFDQLQSIRADMILAASEYMKSRDQVLSRALYEVVLNAGVGGPLFTPRSHSTKAYLSYDLFDRLPKSVMTNLSDRVPKSVLTDLFGLCEGLWLFVDHSDSSGSHSEDECVKIATTFGRLEPYLSGISVNNADYSVLRDLFREAVKLGSNVKYGL